MSRVLVATLGSVGDLLPFLAIARALVWQGHSVLFLSSEPHRATVEAEGVPFASILSAHDHERAARHPDLWHPIRGFGVLWRHLAVRSVDATVALLRSEVASQGASLRVVASPLVLGARLAVDVLPFRLITAHTAPSAVRHLGDPLFLGAWQIPAWWPRRWRRVAWDILDRWKLQPMGAPFIDQWRVEHSLAPLQAPVFDRWLHSPHRVLGLFPESFRCDEPDPPAIVHCVGFPLFQPAAPAPQDAELADWLTRAPERPRVAIYAGSSHHHRSDDFLACATALDAQGVATLLLMAGESPGQLGTYGLRRAWVDLPKVLPHCHGWLHHGGIGASAEGLRSGVRQWTVPSAYDQFENSWHVAKGSGLATSQVLLSAPQVRRGQLPQLALWSTWQRQSRLSEQDGGDASVDRAIQAILTD